MVLFFLVYFTVDELPDWFRQHGVLWSPGENRAGRGGFSHSGERPVSIFSFYWQFVPKNYHFI